MINPTIAKLAVSTLVLGVTMVGCKPASEGSRPRSASDVVPPADCNAREAVDAASRAVAKGDLPEAVRQAELAVASAPQDAGYRATLAEVYLKSGRFDSAASAYRDVLRLNPEDARAKLSLALTQIGLGRNAEAIATLNGAEGRIAPADHGLALALAGDRDGALRLLTAAAREAGATGRVRQNLALTHALAGDWMQARAIAAQDVSPDELDERLAKWAQFAQPRASHEQVATLLGVTPTTDAGQPTRLALVRAVPETVQVAALEAPAPVVEASVVEASAPMPEDFAPDAEPVAVAVAEPAPVEIAPAIVAALASVERVLPRQMARPVSRAIRTAAAAPMSLKGRYVVQIGAFGSASGAERAWNGAVGRLDRLANYVPASTRFAVGRGSVTRLSVGGFASRAAAADLCDSLRRAGGHCFVRASAGDAPVRWAGRATGKRSV